MTSLPENSSGSPRKVRLRRAPKYVPFMIAGALAGVVTAAIFTFALPPNNEFSASSVFGLLAVLLMVPGIGFGAIVALVLDRQGRRRSRTLLLEALPDDDSNREGESA